MINIIIDGQLYANAKIDSISIITGGPPVPASPQQPNPEPAPQPNPDPVSPPPIGGPCPPNLAITDTVLDASNQSTNIIVPSSASSGHVFKFTTPEANTVLTINVAEFAGYQSIKTAVVSKLHCDFDINSPSAIDKAVQQRPSFIFSVGFSSPGYTRLEPNTTYYLNVTHADHYGNPTCPDGTSCQLIVVHNVSR